MHGGEAAVEQGDALCALSLRDLERACHDARQEAGEGPVRQSEADNAAGGAKERGSGLAHSASQLSILSMAMTEPVHRDAEAEQEVGSGGSSTSSLLSEDAGARSPPPLERALSKPGAGAGALEPPKCGCGTCQMLGRCICAVPRVSQSRSRSQELLVAPEWEKPTLPCRGHSEDQRCQR